MERIELAGRSLRAELVAFVAALLVSLVSFVGIVALYASASGELDIVVAKLKAAPAASAVAIEAPRKPKSG
ncbi:MAG: hypothetical protein HS128_07955 [Ideonella sp.]|nr:hypothetical protein [Ideonella sp.]MCC7458226.1 hypothetical protein [Nitrospira sp.]